MGRWANFARVVGSCVGDVKRNRRRRGACPAWEGTLVNYGHILQMDGSHVAILVDLHGVVRDLYNPKNTIGRDPGIEIMYL